MCSLNLCAVQKATSACAMPGCAQGTQGEGAIGELHACTDLALPPHASPHHQAPQPSPHRSFGRLILPACRRACLVDCELGRHTPMASVLACAEADRAHRRVIATQ
ncbi:hypothetical protein HaLaN_16080 [Haematococcus lacustris]|uniref:Uncharacterized protein n=1 Tax=Haematococcus lacustris TaxID=44745 RepID=A0A699ZK31_HAELA|nr:hypothetical protein HaLaN_16080 [Haematococcus lacustris]